MVPLESKSLSVVSNSLRPHGLHSPWNSPGQNTGVGSLSLLQGIFPTQGLNPGLPNCRRILYQLSYKGSPGILEWVAYPFSSESSWLRNQTGVSCIAGRFFTNWAIRESQSQEPKSHLILCHILLQQRIEISNTHTHTQEWRWGREDKPCFWLFLQKYPTSVHDPNSEYMFMAAVNTAKKPAPTGTVTHGDLGKEECSLHEAYNFNFLF